MWDNKMRMVPFYFVNFLMCIAISCQLDYDLLIREKIDLSKNLLSLAEHDNMWDLWGD